MSNPPSNQLPVPVVDRNQWNRFHRIPRLWAALVLAVVAGLFLYAILGNTGSSHIRSAGKTAMQANGLVGDHALYSVITQRVADGQGYYDAASQTQRENGYPLKPFLTVRWPTLAYFMATFGEKITQWSFFSVGLLTILLWRSRLAAMHDLPRYAQGAALLMAPNLVQPLSERAWLYMHETITGTLIALALVLYRPKKPWAAMAVMALAMSIREMAIPVAIIFGIFALWDRDWRAVGGWLALGFAFLGLEALHINAIQSVLQAGDLSSPGWRSSGGWLGYISFIYKTSIFHDLYNWVAALLICLSLLGWAGWKSRLGLAGFCIHVTFALLFSFMARPDNFYWALLVVPSLFIGLIFAPTSLVALVQSLVQGRGKQSHALLA